MALSKANDVLTTQGVTVGVADIDILVAAYFGTGVISGCQVTERAAGPDMSVDVAAGVVTVQRRSVRVTAVNRPISASDPSFDRIDLVVVDTLGTVSLWTGPTTSPVELSLAFDTFKNLIYAVLAKVVVVANVLTIVNAAVVDRRVMLRPANKLQPLLSTTLR